MIRNKFIVSIILIIFLIQGSTNQVKADQWDNIFVANKITIGMDTTYPPFQWVENSQIVGYEIDLSNRIGEILRVQVEIVTTEWDPIISNLQNGDFDIIMSAMTITPERQNIIDFSAPYFKDTLGLMVQSGNPLNINSIKDANSTSLKIGLISGSSSEIWAVTHLVDAQIFSFTNNINIYEALTIGDVDVVMGRWYTIGRDIITGISDGEIVDWGFGEDSSFGIGVRKGEIQLLGKLNNAIATMLHDGTYANITSSWFFVSGSIADTFVHEVKITETYTETVTETNYVTERSVEVTTSTFIDSKAEVPLDPMLSWALPMIGIPIYITRKRR